MNDKYKEHKGDERRETYSLDQLKELIVKSTKVVNWYPYFDKENPTIRGPHTRWFTVSGGNTAYTADPNDDANYAAAAMNALPSLIEKLELTTNALNNETRIRQNYVDKVVELNKKVDELSWDGALNEAEDKIAKLEKQNKKYERLLFTIGYWIEDVNNPHIWEWESCNMWTFSNEHGQFIGIYDSLDGVLKAFKDYKIDNQ